MTAAEILAHARAHGLELRLVGDRVAVSPRSRLSAGLLELLRRYREEIASVLRLRLPATCAACGEVSIVMFWMEPGADGEPWALCRGCYL